MHYDAQRPKSTKEWISANVYTPRNRKGEIRIMKYLYVAITIMNDVLWRGREGVFALSRLLILFQIVSSLLINLHVLLRYPTPNFYFLMGPHATPCQWVSKLGGKTT